MGRDSSVGIATRYVLDGPGIESLWGARFSASVQTGPGANPASYTMGTGSFPRVKRPGRVVDHPPVSSGEVIERVELYLYISGPPWPVLGWTLPVPLPLSSLKMLTQNSSATVFCCVFSNLLFFSHLVFPWYVPWTINRSVKYFVIK